MPASIPRILRRVRALTAAGRVHFTLKALRELAALCLDASDACKAIEGLAPVDLVMHVWSATTDEWMHVFKPHVGGAPVYVKLVLRRDCIVVSFHDDQHADDDE